MTKRSLLALVCIVTLVGTVVSSPSLPVAAHQSAGTTSGGMAQVIIEMRDAPATAVLRQEQQRRDATTARQLAQDQVHQLDQQQQQLLPAIARLGGTVLFRLQRVYAGIAVRLPAAHIAALSALPGVKAVHAAVPDHVTNAISVPLINAPAAWTYNGGLLGKGIKIAIIDTGIDYTHADFGGGGTQAAFDRAAADPTVIEPGSGFPNAKIVGGKDFVGDAYDADGGADLAIPRPDPDPLDCYGHGTHVAGTAAGYGVDADGHTFHGPYDGATPFDSLKIGPGVAPAAQMYALKIFGCSGSSVVTPAAIEWAIDPNGDGDFRDRMDVINMSLGSAFGSSYDATTVAVENAALAGIVVVCSAGNDGDTYYDVSTPGSASYAIQVASTGGTGISGFSSRGPRRDDNTLKPDLAAPGENIFSALRGGGSDGTYLSGTSMATPHVAGSAALLRELHPDWTVEEIKAALMNTTSPKMTYDEQIYSPVRAGSGRVDAGRTVRQTTLAYNADDPGLVSLSFGMPEVVDRLTQVKNLRISDKRQSGPPLTYALSVSPILTVTGAMVTSLVPSVTLRPSTTTTVPIMLSIPDARKLSYRRDPTMDEQSNDVERHFLNELAGAIVLTPSDHTQATTLVNYWAAPRRADQLSLPGTPLVVSTTISTTTLTLRGSSFAAPSLMSAYELQLLSPKRTPSLTETGTITEAGRAADLQYVGIASTFKADNISDSQIAWGLATYTPWATPAEVRFEIGIDSDLDGMIDHTVYTTDYGPGGLGGGYGDAFVAMVRDEASGGVEPAGLLNYIDGGTESGIYGGRVMGLSVGAAQIGLTGAHTRFKYRVRSYHIDVLGEDGAQSIIDETPLLTYDPAHPGITLLAPMPKVPGTPLLRVGDGTLLRIRSDGKALQGNRTQGLLLVYHTNTAAAQAQTVAIRPVDTPPDLPPTYHLLLPLIGR